MQNVTTYYPAPYLSSDNMIAYQLAHNISMYDLLNLTAVIQKHIDQGISTTLYVDSSASTKDLMMYYFYNLFVIHMNYKTFLTSSH